MTKKNNVIEFEFDLDQLEGLFEEILCEILESEEELNQPITLGFTIKIVDGKKSNIKRIDFERVKEEPNPLINVVEQKTNVEVTIDLAGINDKKIDYGVYRNKFFVKINSLNFYKEFLFNKMLNRQIRRKIKNNILILSFTKKNSQTNVNKN